MLQKVPTSPIVCAGTALENLKWQNELSCLCSTYVYILMNHLIATIRLAVIVSKIVKRVVSDIIFTSYAPNVCLQHEREHVDAGATTPTARSMNSVILTIHAFLMRRHSLSTSSILVRRHLGHVM